MKCVKKPKPISHSIPLLLLLLATVSISDALNVHRESTHLREKIHFDDEDCEPLPETPPGEDEPELGLLELLTKGSDLLKNYTNENEVILLLGNTGAGKSTVAQMLVDVSKLRAVVAPGDRLVIIDEDSKIGGSTKSKTLIPELFYIPGDPPQPIYDCPGFDDTRGPVSDIAANFFVNEILQKIGKVKLLFLVIHSSVKLGNDRIDFDLMAKHAATFVKNMDKFSKSFALIVTKVDNFNNRGEYIQDSSIIEGTVAFLTAFRSVLNSDLGSGNPELEELTKQKITFVDTLLETDPATGNYSKIWFVRTPMECGPLSESEMYQDTKRKLVELYEGIEFTEIEPATDFGFTLKDSTILNIANYTDSINKGISDGAQKVTDDLTNHYLQTLRDSRPDKGNLTAILESMKKTNGNVKILVHELETLVASNNSNPTQFSNSLNAFWNSFGYTLSSQFRNYLTWQEIYLKFFDKAAENPQERLGREWAKPLFNFQKFFNDYLEWYDFCVGVETRVNSYEFQRAKPNPPAEKVDWLEFLESNDIVPISDRIKEIASRMPQKEIDLLNKIMTFALQKSTANCNSGLLIIQGNFIVVENLPDILKQCADVTQVDFYASHTIYQDKAADLTTPNFVLLAPKIIEVTQPPPPTTAPTPPPSPPPASLRLPVTPNELILNWPAVLRYKMTFFQRTDTITVNYIQHLNTDPKLRALFNLKGLAEESLSLQNVNILTANNQRLSDMYVMLLDRLEEYKGQKYSNSTPEEKKVIVMHMVTALSAHASLRNRFGLSITVEAPSYLEAIRKQILFMDTVTDKNAINHNIQEDKKKTQGNLFEKLKQSGNFTLNDLAAAIENARGEIEAQLGQLEELTINKALLLEDAEKQVLKAEIEHRIHRSAKTFGFIQSFGFRVTPSSGDMFESMFEHLRGKVGHSKELLFRLQEMVNVSETQNEDIQKRGEELQTFSPVITSVLQYFSNLTEAFATGKDATPPKLALSKQQILGKLRESKVLLSALSDESRGVPLLVTSFDQTQDVLTLALDLYELIDQYLKTKNLAAYFATMQSAELVGVPVENPEYVNTVAKFDAKLKESLQNLDVQKATHIFNQWVFPFAKLYKAPSIQPGVRRVEQIDYLQAELSKYQRMFIGDRENLIFQTNFSSGLRNSEPFFTWENEKCGGAIESLFSGQVAHLNADVTLQGKPGWEAVKFKLIEINLKLKDATPELQAEFDELLDYFGVTLTHSGVSYYRFRDDYFMMTGESQKIVYNMERDGNGNRVGTNAVYEMFKRGNIFLSPYTSWEISLFKVTPTLKQKGLRSDVGFDKLTKFVPHVDVELVGIGTYVDGEEALKAASGDLELAKHYDSTDRLGEGFLFI